MKHAESALIRFVGDPFVDAGVAVLEYRIEKPCEEFTLADLSKQANELEKMYTTSSAWAAYLTVHFQNSCWCNPSMNEETKAAERQNLLRSFDAATIAGRSCIYCQRPAQHNPNGSIIPLTTGKGIMTCGPGGEPGVPICSACQFAIQFYPLATMKVQGNALYWWTPHHEWMYALTADLFERTQRLIEGSLDGVPNVRTLFTRLFDSIETVLKFHPHLPAQDLFGCHSTNLRKAPDYREIRIHRGVVDFIRFGQGHPVYRAIRDESWEFSAAKSKKKAPIEEPPREMRRNRFYEDLGTYLQNGDFRDGGVVRRYFTKHAGQLEGTFELATVFARKVLGMTQEQIDAIKELADRIAGSAKASDHRRRLSQSRKTTNYISSITDISSRMVRAGEPPIAMESVLKAFNMATDNDPFTRDAGLARELILLRIIEKLPASATETELEDTEE